MTSTRDPLAWLAENGAQRDVLDGLRALALGEAATPLEKWKALWKACPRGDWMLGIGARLGVDVHALVRAGASCAELVLDQAESPLARDLIEAARTWTTERTTTAELSALARALDAAPATSPAADAAHRAAVAVGLGIEDPAVLAAAASSAAEAMFFATLDCGMELVVSYAHGKTADAVRAEVSVDEIARRVNAA